MHETRTPCPCPICKRPAVHHYLEQNDDAHAWTECRHCWRQYGNVAPERRWVELDRDALFIPARRRAA